MMATEWLTVDGRRVTLRGALDHYLYAVPEEDDPEPTVARFVRGDEVAPQVLADALLSAVQSMVGVSEAAMVALTDARERLLEAFPETRTGA